MADFMTGLMLFSSKRPHGRMIFGAVLFLTTFSAAAAQGNDSASRLSSRLASFSLAAVEHRVGNAGRFFQVNPEKETPSATIESEPPQKKTGRAVLEFFVLTAPSQILYWTGIFGPPQEWSYRLTWKDQSKRFFTFQAWKFDVNCFFLNWMHGPIGAVYYEIARSNHLNRFESFLFTLGGSLYWEYVTEYRSVISINDNIFTAIGGIPIGETWHVLGGYFLSKSGFLNRLLGFLNPILKYNTGRDRKTGSSFSRLPEPGWHDFRLAFGFWTDAARTARRPGTNLFADIDAQILSLPDADQPGDAGKLIKTTLFNEFSAALVGAGGAVEESRFICRSVYLGYFRKNIDANLDGYRFSLGLGSAFSFYKKRSVAFYDSTKIIVKNLEALQLEEPRNFRDKFSAAHLVGPVFDLTVRRGRFQGRLTAEAYFDFSLVNALALNAYSETHDISGAKTTLTYFGYYYAFGGSIFLRLEAEAGPLEFSGLFSGHAWGSIDGGDQFQDEIRDNFHLRDSRAFLQLRAGYRFGESPLVLLLSYERISRRGFIKDVKATDTESRASAGFLFRF